MQLKLSVMLMSAAFATVSIFAQGGDQAAAIEPSRPLSAVEQEAADFALKLFASVWTATPSNSDSYVTLQREAGSRKARYLQVQAVKYDVDEMPARVLADEKKVQDLEGLEWAGTVRFKCRTGRLTRDNIEQWESWHPGAPYGVEDAMIFKVVKIPGAWKHIHSHDGLEQYRKPSTDEIKAIRDVKDNP